MAHASNYHAWIADHLRGAWDGAGRVLDVGCSIGNVTQAIVDAVADQQTLVVGLETRPDAGRRFAERFASRDNVRLASFDITAPASELDALGPFDAAVSVGLLEHIDDDVAALRAVAARLKPGGRLGLLVPGGGDRLYGTLDGLDGHFRRYTTPRLSARLRAAGFEVVTIRPVSMAGAVAWFLKGRVLRSRRLSAGEVRVLDRAIPVVRRIDAVLGPPFGQSLVAIARLP